MTRIATAAILLLLTAALPAADLTLPETVEGPVGSFITVPAETDGDVVRWHAIDAGINLFPTSLLKSTHTAVVTSPRSGRFRLLAYTSVDNVPSEPAVVTVIVGNAPEPGPTPDPQPDPDDDDVEPTPDDKAPFPADGLHVLIVYESEDTAKLTDDQREIIAGATTRASLNSIAPRQYRFYDPDADLQFVAPAWKAAMAVPRESLPWLVISNGETGYNGPLDMTPADFLTLVGKHK